MRYIILVISVYLLNGCKKEETTNYYAYWNNKTNHIIEVRPYTAGNIIIEKIVTLLPGESKEIARGFDRGIVNNAGFNSEYLSGSDSIVVVFDNIYSISHYFNPPVTFASKYYLYESARNINNYLSYVYAYKDLSRHKRENTYNYNFIEQDYFDAQ